MKKKTRMSATAPRGGAPSNARVPTLAGEQRAAKAPGRATGPGSKTARRTKPQRDDEDDELVLNLDADPINADWIKVAAYRDGDILLDEFKKMPVYQEMVERGLIDGEGRGSRDG